MNILVFVISGKNIPWQFLDDYQDSTLRYLSKKSLVLQILKRNSSAVEFFIIKFLHFIGYYGNITSDIAKLMINKYNCTAIILWMFSLSSWPKIITLSCSCSIYDHISRNRKKRSSFLRHLVNAKAFKTILINILSAMLDIFCIP